ncbi:MAG: PAS domain S-box protein [Thermoplasmatota archaeon]
MCSRGWRRLRDTWRHVVEPLSPMRDEGMRRRSRLLASLLFSFMMLLAMVLVASATVDLAEPFLSSATMYLSMGLLAVLFGAYVVTRMGFYVAGAAVTVGTLSLAVFGAAIVVVSGWAPRYDPGDVNLLVFLIFPLLFSGMLLSLRQTLVFAVADGVGMLMLPLFFSHISVVDVLGGPLLLFVVVALLVAWTSLHRSQMEEIRRAELARSEERYRSIVEHAHAGILVVDDAYRIGFVNERLCQILGYSREELLGEDFRRFLDAESRELVAGRYRRRQRGDDVPSSYEFNVLTRDGETRRVQIISTMIQDVQGGGPQTMAQVLDITERMQAEREREQAMAEMHRALELEKRFKADAAHFFLNPIAIAKGYMEIAMEDMPDGCRDKIRASCNAVRRVENVIKNIVEKGEIRE